MITKENTCEVVAIYKKKAEVNIIKKHGSRESLEQVRLSRKKRKLKLLCSRKSISILGIK